MTILCCCHNNQTLPRGSSQRVFELPTPPARARLSKSPYPAPEQDMNLSPIVTSRPLSRLDAPMHHAEVNPEILDLEDSDDENPRPGPSTRDSSTGTLDAIKTKLIRRLSQKSHPKRRSRQGLGSSEEEIARRAELKRLMHKRIQEELKSEEELDRKENSIEQPNGDNCREPSLPGGGPRDTLEFSVTQVEEDEPTKHASPTRVVVPLVLSPDSDGPQTLQRRSSFPNLSHRSSDNLDPARSTGLAKRGSMPHMPSSPLLAPVHIPSRQASSSSRSWNLSNSAGHLLGFLGPPEDSKCDLASQYSATRIKEVDESSAKCRRPESPERRDTKSRDSRRDSTSDDHEEQDNSQTRVIDAENDSRGSPDWAETRESSLPDGSGDHQYSPLDIWLRSQELQAASIASSRPSSGLLLTKVSHSQDRGEPRNGDRSSEQQSNPSIGSDRPTRLVPNLARQPPGAWPVSEASSAVVELFFDSPSEESNTLRRIPAQGNQCHGDKPRAERVCDPGLHLEPASRYSSSRYTTRPNSRQPTPRDSRLWLSDFLGGRKGISPPFMTFQRRSTPNTSKGTDDSNGSSYKTAPNGLLSSNWTINRSQPSRQPTDNCSVAASDTASFRQREAELKSIEKRFGSTTSRRDPSASAVSKFREEFDNTRQATHSRNSLLTKLHLPSTRKPRASSQYPHLQVRANMCSSDVSIVSTHQQELIPLSTGTTSHTPYEAGGIDRVQSTTTGLWQRAIRSEASRRGSQLGVEPCEPDDANTRHNRTDSGKETPRVPSSFGSGSPDRSPVLPVPIKSRHSGDRGAVGPIPRVILSAPGNQQEIEHAGKPQDTGVMYRRQLFRNGQIPPSSWAKWPSHTRHERSGAAGKKDRVATRDFARDQATQEHQAASPTHASTTSPSTRNPAPLTRSLSSHVGKSIKERWNRLMNGKEHVGQDPELASIEPRLSQRQGHLEYPELELLPTPQGYREVQALEREIETMKRMSVSRGRFQSSSDATRSHLTTRLTEGIHQLQHSEEVPSSFQTGESAYLRSTDRLSKTPSQAFSQPRTVSGMTEYETPKSHISYEDCVPTHMLEEDGNQVAHSATQATVKPADTDLKQHGSVASSSQRHNLVNSAVGDGPKTPPKQVSGTQLHQRRLSSPSSTTSARTSVPATTSPKHSISSLK
ncbi:hypothetical protein F4780DRAFT_236056 [Xylariomycetidae sp. FL0641]|nr:hypothetical protein F4780DRAFT_236056 [Xylariomycetidae sp. FL0641]